MFIILLLVTFLIVALASTIVALLFFRFPSGARPTKMKKEFCTALC